MEHDVEDITQASESGVVKEEIVGTTASHSVDAEVLREETIKVSQEKEKREASEEETTSERKQVNEKGRLQSQLTVYVSLAKGWSTTPALEPSLVLNALANFDPTRIAL